MLAVLAIRPGGGMARPAVSFPTSDPRSTSVAATKGPLMLPTIRSRSRWLLPGIAALLVGCGGEGSAIGPDEFHRIGGSYTGGLEGTSSDGEFSGAIFFTLSQSQGSLTGTYYVTGDLYRNSGGKYFWGSDGTVEGSIAPGPRPDVSLTLTPDTCPNQPWTYAGSYDAGRRQISISADVLVRFTCVSLPMSHSTVLTRD